LKKNSHSGFAKQIQVTSGVVCIFQGEKEKGAFFFFIISCSIPMSKEKDRHNATGIESGDRTWKGISRSWLLVLASIFAGMCLSFRLHYQLPSPANHLGLNLKTNITEFSEKNAIKAISYLSETVGYRMLEVITNKKGIEHFL
jgi:hypothetical protein